VFLIIIPIPHFKITSDQSQWWFFRTSGYA